MVSKGLIIGAKYKSPETELAYRQRGLRLCLASDDNRQPHAMVESAQWSACSDGPLSFLFRQV